MSLSACCRSSLSASASIRGLHSSAAAHGVLTKRQRARLRPKRDETLYGQPELRPALPEDWTPDRHHPLWQFFHIGEPLNVAAPPVDAKTHDSGRAWLATELRRKSFADLHQLWFILMKERNILLTQKHEFRRLLVPINQTFVQKRLAKVQTSMARIKSTLSERRIGAERLITLLNVRRMANPNADPKDDTPQQAQLREWCKEDPEVQKILSDPDADSMAWNDRMTRARMLADRGTHTLKEAYASVVAEDRQGPAQAVESADAAEPIDIKSEIRLIRASSRPDPIRKALKELEPPEIPKLAVEGNRSLRQLFNRDSIFKRYQARMTARELQQRWQERQTRSANSKRRHAIKLQIRDALKIAHAQGTRNVIDIASRLPVVEKPPTEARV